MPLDGLSRDVGHANQTLSPTTAQRQNWELCGAGYSIHWPKLDEDLSTEGLLRGAKGAIPRH